MASFNKDFYDRSPSDDGEIYGRRFDRFLDSYMAASPAPPWDPEDGRTQSAKSQATPRVPVRGPGGLDCVQNTARRLPRSAYMNNSAKPNVDEVPAGTTKPSKKSKKTRTMKPMEVTDPCDMTRADSRAWELINMNKERRGTPIQQQDEFGYISKGPIIDEHSILAEKTNREYDKTCIIMSRLSLATTIKGRQKSIFNKLDAPLPPLGKTVPDSRQCRPNRSPTFGRRIWLNNLLESARSPIPHNRISPSKVPMNTDALSGKSYNDMAVERSTSPRQDKATSPFAIINDYLDSMDYMKESLTANENISSHGDLPLSKMLSIDDEGCKDKRSCAEKAGMLQMSRENSDMEIIMSTKVSTLNGIDNSPIATETNKRRSPLSVLKSPPYATGATSVKPNLPSTTVSSDIGTDWINSSNKEFEDLIDSRTCKWRGMYDEVKHNMSKTATPRTTRKLNKHESMWYTNRGYKEDATAYFFDPALRKQRPESRAVSRLEASLGYTEPVRGTRVIQTSSKISILSDEVLSPLPERPKDTTPSPDDYTMSESNYVPHMQLEKVEEMSGESDCEDAKHAPHVMDTASLDRRGEVKAETDSKMLPDTEHVPISKENITDDTPEKKSRKKKSRKRMNVEELKNKTNTKLEKAILFADESRLPVESHEKMRKAGTSPVFEEGKEATQALSETQKADVKLNEPKLEEITKSKTVMKQSFKSSKIGKALFKKSGKKSNSEVVAGALKDDTKKCIKKKKGLKNILKFSGSKISTSGDDACCKERLPGKEKCETNVECQKEGGVIGYLRTSWIGRNLLGRIKMNVYTKMMKPIICIM